MAQPIPYQSPMPCPFCGSHENKPAGFTWWGGLLGPKILNHVKCSQCGKGFNGKKGTSNNTAITWYLIISFFVCFIIGLVLFFVGFFNRF